MIQSYLEEKIEEAVSYIKALMLELSDEEKEYFVGRMDSYIQEEITSLDSEYIETEMDVYCLGLDENEYGDQ